MISIQGIITIILLPISVLICIIRTFYNGGPYVKFKYELYINIKLMLADKMLNLPVQDCGYFAISPRFQINYLVPLLHPQVKKFPGYGQSFDCHSIWLIKNCNIENRFDNPVELDFKRMDEILLKDRLYRSRIDKKKFQPQNEDFLTKNSKIDFTNNRGPKFNNNENGVNDYRYFEPNMNSNESDPLVSRSEIVPKCSLPIIIYLHGGGYFIETSLPHLQAILSIYKLLEEQHQKKVSILHLSYKLTSKGFLMPYQLLQLFQTYLKLIDNGYRNIILLGDSAGGNLAVTFCQYLKQINFPIYPTKLILISPWVKIYPDPYQNYPGHSYYDNHGQDILNFQSCTKYEKIFHITGSLEKVGSLLISPGNIPQRRDYWQDIPNFNYCQGSDICIIFGGNEVLKDDIINFIDYSLGIKLNLSSTNDEFIITTENNFDIRIYMEPFGIHDSMFVIENRLNDSKFDYGLIRVAKFLNDTLNKL